MDEQSKKLLRNPNKNNLNEIQKLLLDEYNKGVDNLVNVLLFEANSKVIPYFFSNTDVDNHAIVEYLKGNLGKILRESNSKKKGKVCINALNIVSSLKDITEFETLTLLILVISTNSVNQDILKKLSDNFIANKNILKYDYSKLSVIDRQRFGKYFKIIFEDNSLCIKQLPDYAEWVKKYGSNGNVPQREKKSVETPTPKPTKKKRSKEFNNSSNDVNIKAVKSPKDKPLETPVSTVSAVVDNTKFEKLESLISTESDNVSKLENLIQRFETTAKLTEQLNAITTERDSLKTALSTAESQVKDLNLAITVEKTLAEQSLTTLKIDIKKALKQSYDDYTEMKHDEAIDKFCLGTIGNIFRALARYGINLDE